MQISFRPMPTHTSISQTQLLDMMLSTCTQLLWSTMARSVLSRTCPVKPWQSSYSLRQRFSIPVLAPHRSAHFVCYSYHFRRLFYSNASALRSGHHTIFLHDSGSKRTYSIHSALKCARREFKLYIFTDVYDVTLVRA